MKLLKNHRWVKPSENIRVGDKFYWTPKMLLRVDNNRMGKARVAWFFMRPISGNSAGAKKKAIT